jgi:hypothetical protein
MIAHHGCVLFLTFYKWLIFTGPPSIVASKIIVPMHTNMLVENCQMNEKWPWRWMLLLVYVLCNKCQASFMLLPGTCFRIEQLGVLWPCNWVWVKSCIRNIWGWLQDAPPTSTYDRWANAGHQMTTTAGNNLLVWIWASIYQPYEWNQELWQWSSVKKSISAHSLSQ